MGEKDHSKQSSDTNGICRLEWIAWAIDAARRHKANEQHDPEAVPRRVAVPFENESAPR